MNYCVEYTTFFSKSMHQIAPPKQSVQTISSAYNNFSILILTSYFLFYSGRFVHPDAHEWMNTREFVNGRIERTLMKVCCYGDPGEYYVNAVIYTIDKGRNRADIGDNLLKKLVFVDVFKEWTIGNYILIYQL